MQHTLPGIPFLQFGSEPTRAANLANIPQHFDLELYAEHRLQKVLLHLLRGCIYGNNLCTLLYPLTQHLQSLLSHLHQLTLKHLDIAVSPLVLLY